MRAAVAANVLAGNMAEAQKVVAAMRLADPKLSLSSYKTEVIRYRRTQDRDLMIDALRRAGLPE